jgi:hypothetical protein
MSDFFSERVSHVALRPTLPVRYLPPQKNPAHPEKKYHAANGLTGRSIYIYHANVYQCHCEVPFYISNLYYMPYAILVTEIQGKDLWSNDISKRDPPQVTTTCQQCQKYYSEVWCDDQERYLCTWCNRELHEAIGNKNQLRKPLYDSSTQKRWHGDIQNDQTEK